MIKSKVIIKICLLFFIIVIIVVASYVLFNANSISTITEEYENINNSYEVMSQNLKMMKSYENRKQEMLNEINQLNILKSFNQVEIINTLDECMKVCNINASKITFSEVQPVSINDENTPIENNGVENVESQVSQMSTITVSVEFISTYDEMVLFIDEIQNNKTEISIANLRIANQNEGESVHCVINLNFYVLPL